MEKGADTAEMLVDLHHTTLGLDQNNDVGTRIWHLMVSIRRLADRHSVNADTLWSDTIGFHMANPGDG